MKHAFEAAGFDRLRFELKAVAPRFNREDWIAIYDEATKEMGKIGHFGDVHQDHHKAADLSHPTPSEGHTAAVQPDHLPHADARQPLLSADIRTSVQQDQKNPVSTERPIASGKASFMMPVKAKVTPPPAREPSDADIEALKASGDFNYFQMINLRKKAWSTYRYKQLSNVRSLNMQENMIIQEVIQWGRKHKINEDDLVSLTMPVSEMKKIVRDAKNAIPSKAEVIFKTKKRSAGRGR